MRRVLLSVFLCVAVIGGWQAWHGFSVRAQSGNDHNLGFGQRIAGTWYYDQIYYNEELLPNRVLVSVSADGTFVGTETDDFVEGFGSPMHGTWMRSGPRDIEVVYMGFVYDESGELRWLYHATASGHYSHDFNSLSASYVYGIFYPEQDPMVEDPLITGGGTMRGRRLQFE